MGDVGSSSRTSALLKLPVRGFKCVQHEAKGHNSSSCYFGALITYLPCHKRNLKHSINTAGK